MGQPLPLPSGKIELQKFGEVPSRVLPCRRWGRDPSASAPDAADVKEKFDLRAAAQARQLVVVDAEVSLIHSSRRPLVLLVGKEELRRSCDGRFPSP